MREFTIRGAKRVEKDGTLIDDNTPFKVSVSEPAFPESTELTKEDVWGKYDLDTGTRIHKGMIVARSKEVCPHFGDTVPYKSVTVVCDAPQEAAVSYWLDYVQGGNSISDRKELLEGKQVALRADYQCW